MRTDSGTEEDDTYHVLFILIWHIGLWLRAFACTIYHLTNLAKGLDMYNGNIIGLQSGSGSVTYNDNKS